MREVTAEGQVCEEMPVLPGAKGKKKSRFIAGEDARAEQLLPLFHLKIMAGIVTPASPIYVHGMSLERESDAGSSCSGKDFRVYLLGSRIVNGKADRSAAHHRAGSNDKRNHPLHHLARH